MKIRFLIVNNRINKLSKSVIKTRITYLKQRKEFSTGIFINPKNWLGKQQAIKPDEPDANLKETQLSLIKTKLSQAFLFYRLRKQILKLSVSNR